MKSQSSFCLQRIPATITSRFHWTNARRTTTILEKPYNNRENGTTRPHSRLPSSYSTTIATANLYNNCNDNHNLNLHYVKQQLDDGLRKGFETRRYFHATVISNHSKKSNKNKSTVKRQAMKRQLEHNPDQESSTSSKDQDIDMTIHNPSLEPNDDDVDGWNNTTTATAKASRTIDTSADMSSLSSSFPTTTMPTKLDLLQFQPHHKESYTAWESSLTHHSKTLASSKDESNQQWWSNPTEDGIMSRDISTELMELEDMYDPNIHLPYAPKNWNGYEVATPLSDVLMKRIGVVGKPLTVAEYMSEALTHPQYGYYTNPPKSKLQKSLLQEDRASDDDFDNDDDDDDDDDDWDDNSNNENNPGMLIGAKGDFVTAPEVSHVFGQCICIWFMTQWQNVLGRPDQIQLVELGPGKGTLMMDILHLATSKQLRHFGRCIAKVHLIEASLTLRKQQEELLSQHLHHQIEFHFVNSSSTAKQKDGTTTSASIDADMFVEDGGNYGEGDNNKRSSDKISIQVEWHDNFASFQRQQESSNKRLPTLMVLQEFLDALPVHIFEHTEEGWRERLIDVVSKDDNPPNPNHDPLVPRLRQVVAPGITPAVELLLPQYIESNNNNPDKQSYQDTAEFKSSNIPVGTVVEICPQAMFLVQDMAELIDEQDGVALIIDYGQEGTSDTIRAFSNHKQVPLTSYPGQVDVTADVDFFVLKECVNRNQKQKQQGEGFGSQKEKHTKTTTSAFGPITQGEFLMRMGAGDLVISKVEDDSTTEEQAVKLAEALKFLVMPEFMGERYKVLALGKKRDGIFKPPGFES